MPTTKSAAATAGSTRIGVPADERPSDAVRPNASWASSRKRPGPALTSGPPGGGGPCVPVAIRTVTSVSATPASARWRRTCGRIEAAGVGRVRSSTSTRGRLAPRASSRSGGWPVGRSSAAASCPSESAGGVRGENTSTSHSAGKTSSSGRSPYQPSVRTGPNRTNPTGKGIASHGDSAHNETVAIAPTTRPTTRGFLQSIGVSEPLPATSTFDPGYDPATLESHLAQSAHLMSRLKISMACWRIADEAASRGKFAAAAAHGVPTVTGGGPFEIAVAQGRLPEYLDLCADVGATRVECANGFADLELEPHEVVALAHGRGLEVQFELGLKHGGTFVDRVVDELIEQGRTWLDAGAVQLVVEARESAQGVGLFDDRGQLDRAFADRFAGA